MQNYRNPRDTQKYGYKNDQSNQISSAKEEESTWGGYILHWVAFIVAAGIYIGVWAIDYFAVKRQASYFYKNPTTFSPAIDSTTHLSLTSLFGGVDPFDTLGVAISLVYSWVLWKGPLLVYCFHLIELQ